MNVLLAFCLLAASAEADEDERLLPAFIEEPSDVTATLGERILLPCKIANAQGGLVQWTRDGFGLGGGRETDFPGIRVIGANPERDWDLEILHLTLEDDTTFECQVTIDNKRSLRSSARVTVWVPPDPPYINEGPDVTVKESMETAFTCVSRGGKPAARLDWYDHEGNRIKRAEYKKKLMSDGKRFEAESTIYIMPGREHHNSTFRCEAWNDADDRYVGSNGDRIIDRTPALIHLRVQYAPTVEVKALRPGLIEEGSKAAYRCLATANPPPNRDSFRWFIDNDPVPNQFRDYFEIYNVSRLHHDKQVRCSVANELGTAMGLKSIQVRYRPAFVELPKTTAGDNLESVTLRCVVDGNPTPKYRWTKGSSREIISENQNFTVTVTGENVGTYYCHAEVEGYGPITSNPAEVLMTGIPKISSNPVQTGVVGDNVHINCAAVSIPLAHSIVWKYHQTRVDEENSHYRIIDSPIEHGIRSTLIIRQALETDFGPYTCTVANDHGEAQMEIVLERQQPLPLQTILIAVFLAVILVLIIALVVILFRKKIWCCGLLSMSDKKSTTNSSMSGAETISPTQKSGLAKVNNFVDQLSASTHQGSTPSESDCGGWGSGDFPDSLGRTTLTKGVAGDQLCSRTSSDLLDPEIPPKPDVISTGYIPYGSSLRDYNPPVGVVPAPESPNHYGTLGLNQSRQSSVLNVSDPRFSATYGNPYLRQSNPRPLVQCSSFMNSSPQSRAAVNPNNHAVVAAPQSSSSFSSSTSTFQPALSGATIVTNSLSIRPQMNHPQLHGGGGAGGLVVSSVPTVISHYGTLAAPASSSTPNSSVSNMACLPEDPELVAFGEDHTGIPSVSPTPNLTQMSHHQHPRLNNSSSGASSTPSPLNLLPVSQPKVPNVKQVGMRSPTGLKPQPASSGDANFYTMPNRSSIASSSVLGIGGPLYHPTQTLNRSLNNNNGAGLNNERSSNVCHHSTIMYTPLGVNPSVTGSKVVNGDPTYSKVNKPDLSKGDNKSGKVSNVGTHV